MMGGGTCSIYKRYTNSNIKQPVPAGVKNKLNERKRLLKSNRREPSRAKSERIRLLNKDIKSHFHWRTKNKISRTIIPGNPQSLWKADKVAKVKSIIRLI